MVMYPALLGVMELEGNSYEWNDIGRLTLTWLQDAGGFAAIGLLLWVIYVILTPAPAIAKQQQQNPDQPAPAHPPTGLERIRDYSLTIGGLLALLAFCEPFFIDLFRLRWRRIYALARLSFQEAVRRRVVWVFFFVLLV